MFINSEINTIDSKFRLKFFFAVVLSVGVLLLSSPAPFRGPTAPFCSPRSPKCHLPAIDNITLKSRVPIGCPGVGVALTRMNAEGFLKSPSSRPFFIAHRTDEDPGGHQYYMTLIESMVNQAYEIILSRLDPDTYVVVDVGSNAGWFLGVASFFPPWRVVAFDMQPMCTVLAACTSAANRAAGNMIYNSFISHEGGSLMVARGACSGVASLANFVPSSENDKTLVTPVHLSKFFVAAQEDNNGQKLPRDIAILKIDTEGFEVLVIETALPILHRIENILLELTPRKWAAGGISDARARQLFMCLFDADFYAVTLPRRDVDYYVPGDVDMRDPPERLIVNNVDEFMHHVDWAKTAYRELWNPNYWFLRREYISGASQRVRAASVPSCAPSLAVMYDRDDAAGHYTRPGGE